MTDYECFVLCQMVADGRLHAAKCIVFCKYVAECIVLCQMVANGRLHVAEYIVLCQIVANSKLYVAENSVHDR